MSTLSDDLDSLGRTALEIKAQRDELLEALKALLDISPFARTYRHRSIHRRAEAAIARAEGADHA